MSGLIKNELIKIYKQTAYKIIAIIMAVLIVLTPLLIFGVGFLADLLTYNWSITDSRDLHIEAAEEYEAGSAERQYELDMAESYDPFIGEDGAKSWKYDVYFFEYQDLFIRKKALDYLDSGEFSREELDESSYYWYYANLEEIGKTPDDIRREFAAISELVKNATFADHISSERSFYEQQKLAAKADIASLEAALAKAPEDVKTQYALDQAEELLASSENILKAYESVAERANGTDDWRYKTLEFVVRNEDVKNACVVMPEEIFDESFESDLWDSYDDYAEYTEGEYRTSDEASRIFSYSLENDIPVKNMASNVKSNFRSGTVSVMSLVVIASVIVFGLTISSEFSSGTIRLLLIRPQTRTKILTSKIIAALIYVGSFAILGVAVVSVFGVIFGGGFGDLFTPDLRLVGDGVIELPSILGNALAVIGSFLPVLLYGAVALLLSVLTKKAAISIALPLVLNSIGATAQSISFLVASLVGPELVALLPTTYVDLSLFGDTAADYFASMYGGDITALFGGNIYYTVTSQMYPMLGYIYYAVFISAATVLAYIAFSKKQIKD